MLFVTFGKHILHQISLHWEAFHNGSMTIITSKNKTSLPYWVHSRLLEIRKVKLTFYEIQPSSPECHSIQKAGTHIGKVAVRASGSFNVSTTAGVVQGISHKHCSVLHRADGYSYLLKTGAPLGFEKPSIRAQEVS